MLRGKNIILRALEPADVDLLYDWENDTKLWHLSNTVTPFSRFMLEQYVMSASNDIFTAKQLRLMIDKIGSKSKESIGSIDLFDFDPVQKRAGIGIMIVEQEREKGYASEALKILIDYCFGVLELHQVYCNISKNNSASVNLFTKAGFEITGLKKDWVNSQQGWVDEYFLQLIKS